jgi:hypothetical protein
MRQQSFSPDEPVDAGLAYRRLGDGLPTGCYRQRVVVPVRDQQGRVCGLIGRNIGDSRWPKYKNPPSTVAYDKSINLYQRLPAPVATRVGRVVVIERTIGSMAMAMAGAGIQAGSASPLCPVTQSGRKLASAQLDYVLITTLPEGHDPASWLADRGPRGLSAWSPQDRPDLLVGKRSTSCERVIIDSCQAGRAERTQGRSGRQATSCLFPKDTGTLGQSESFVPAL